MQRTTTLMARVWGFLIRRTRRATAAPASVPRVPARLEFDCIECRRHIVRWRPPPRHAIDKCGRCLYSPGWFRFDQHNQQRVIHGD